MPDHTNMTCTSTPRHFLEHIMEHDLSRADAPFSQIVTRFPPEPNGYLHIGHASSIFLNFGLAEKYKGRCHLRFDDTNPETEGQVYVDAIIEDIRWLGLQWDGKVRYASDYFDQLYEWALHLIREGKAYVDYQDPETLRLTRGDFKRPGTDSPTRNTSVEENLAGFEKMRAGHYEEGEACLRARIDMQSPNMNLRDPVLYRICKTPHHQTGNTWCIFPSYDFAHGQEDAIEGITHSICTMEFQDHRPLYDWFLDHLPVPSRPVQYEFARTNISHTVTSKRKLKRLVDEGVVTGWDDPRMPTLSGMRRRGYTPEAIAQFTSMVSVSRTEGMADVSMLESAIRDHLNQTAARTMVVLNPLKLVLTNIPEEMEQQLTAPVHPQRPEMGERKLSLTREIYIDRADFSEDTSLSRKRFKRLVAGEYVRLRNACIIRADKVIKDADGEFEEIHCTALSGTAGGSPPEGVRPRGVIHWVSARLGRWAQLRLYDRLFLQKTPDTGEGDLITRVNPDSLLITKAWIESGLAEAAPE
ncbi:MAG: glutamine--tRNA ligase/YqeY domain fusion protein, partial [Kistimonas sp.]|nr:glutamine--tRNA ligase/YqeY domain fusion protein [Kistimonas sp.]